MSIPTNRLQQLTSVLGTDSVLLDSAAGTARISVANLAQHIRPGQNLLDNWYFLDPNNQRGQTEYDEANLTATSYFIDRWLIGGGITAEVTSEGLRLVTKEAISWRFICQRLEPALLAYLRGKTVTVSCLAKGSGMIWLGNVNLSGLKTLSQEMGMNSYTFTWPKSADEHTDCPMFGFHNNSMGSATLCAMKLELGDHQTLAHQDASGNWVLNDPPPDKALELLKCQRYQIVTGPLICGPIHNGYITSGGKSVTLYFDTGSMRANPTISGNVTVTIRTISGYSADAMRTFHKE